MKVLIVDDHPLVREGLVSVLETLDPPAQVIEAEDVAAAHTALAAHRKVDLILLDLVVPGAEGLSLVNAVRAARPDVPVVIVSANDHRDLVLGAIDAGAMGFISKRSSTAVLVSAIRLVLAGGVYVPPHVLSAVSDPFSGPASARRPGDAPLTPADLGLTDRQADVLTLLVQGMSNKTICKDLDLAEGTVKTHITAILRALKVANRTQALFALSRLGLQLKPPTTRTTRGIEPSLSMEAPGP